MEIIIIRGRQNDGKTTTATMLHNALVWRSSTVRLLRTNGNYLPVLGEVCDFQSVLDIKEKRIVIISEGDYKDSVLNIIDELCYEYRPDILVVCARSYNRYNSTYNMLIDKFGDSIKPENEFWVEYIEDPNKIKEIKQQTVDDIINRINEFK